MTPIRVMVVSAISRESSSCYVLARIAELCRQRDVDVDFVTPAAVGLPVNDGTVPDDLPAARAWQEQASIRIPTCHIWVSPEYHSGMTGRG